MPELRCHHCESDAYLSSRATPTMTPAHEPPKDCAHPTNGRYLADRAGMTMLGHEVICRRCALAAWLCECRG